MKSGVLERAGLDGRGRVLEAGSWRRVMVRDGGRIAVGRASCAARAQVRAPASEREYEEATPLSRPSLRRARRERGAQGRGGR